MRAEVIKVEVPGSGDLARQLGADPALNRALMGASFLAQNAGKRSVTVNLRHPDGRRVFERLAATAEVLVENFRPGVMARLGLGYDHLAALNPGLIYCAISGFGQDGPLSSNPAYDQIIQGLAGIMDVTGDEQTGPLRVGFPICDTAAQAQLLKAALVAGVDHGPPGPVHRRRADDGDLRSGAERRRGRGGEHAGRRARRSRPAVHGGLRRRGA